MTTGYILTINIYEFSYFFLTIRRHAIFPTPSYEKRGSTKGLKGPTFPGVVLLLKQLKYSGVTIYSVEKYYN